MSIIHWLYILVLYVSIQHTNNRPILNTTYTSTLALYLSEYCALVRHVATITILVLHISTVACHISTYY